MKRILTKVLPQPHRTHPYYTNAHTNITKLYTTTQATHKTHRDNVVIFLFEEGEDGDNDDDNDEKAKQTKAEKDDNFLIDTYATKDKAEWTYNFDYVSNTDPWGADLHNTLTGVIRVWIQSTPVIP